MMTCEPLTLFDMPAHGSSQEACPASRPVEPGSNAAAQITAGSGLTLYESFPTSGPLGACLKTLLASETWASPEFYLTWKVSATKCGSSVFRLVPSARRTDANGIGLSDIALWRPPQRESDNANRGNKGQDPARRMKQGHSVSLRDQLPSTLASAWPTPTARDVKGQTQNQERMDYVPNIIKATAWPTPDASEAGKTSRSADRQDEMLMGGIVRSTWPTPKASLASGGLDPYIKDGQGSGGIATHTALGYGHVSSGCLARTESFVERLMTLSAWLMGYTAAYLQHWATASSRRSRKESSPP